MKNIFVGNLDFNTSEEDVRQLFAAHGQVDRATARVRLRGDGEPRKKATRAIAALNGTLRK